MKEYETVTLTARFYVEPSPTTEEHKKFLVAKYLQEKGVCTMQEWRDGGLEPIHPLVIEIT
jgi:hypothetical protein